MNKLWASFMIAVLIVGVAVAGIYVGIIPSGWKPDEITRIKKAGVLVVGVDATYPPLESMLPDGTIVGYDADIAKLIAAKLGVTLQLKNTPFDTIFDALENGSVDIVISSVSITPEREKRMLFSAPYFASGQVLIVAQNTTGITNTSDLNGKRIGVQADTTSKEQALLLTKANMVVDYKDYDAAAVDLKNGKIQAIIIDYPAGADLVKKTGGIRIVGTPFTTESYGIALPLSATHLQALINELIADGKETGELQQIQDTWFK